MADYLCFRKQFIDNKQVSAVEKEFFRNTGSPVRIRLATNLVLVHKGGVEASR